MVRTLLGSLCALLVLVPGAQAGWTAPRPLSGCPPAIAASGASGGSAVPLKGAQIAAAPLIVYPSSEPPVRSGAGALLWDAAGPCARGTSEVFGTPLGAGGLPRGDGHAIGERTDSRGVRGLGGDSGAASAAEGLAAVSAAVGTTAGQVLAAGSTAAGAGAFAESEIAGTFPAALPLGGPAEPVAAASGYLGDAVLVSLAKGPPRARVRARAGSKPPGRAAGSANEVPQPTRWALAVRVQRHYSSAPRPPLLLPLEGAPPDALAVAMDYRSDLLLVWAAGGAIYAREIPQGGPAGPVHRLGGVVGAPELRALYSDDGRAIVAWREQRGSRTSIEVSISDAALQFGAPHTVERFADLPGVAPPPGSLRLVRLSSEAVMMAWTGLRAGRYVVRASPVSLRRGVWAPVVVSAPPVGSSAGDAPPEQALLADLVPGPRAEALALWTAAPLTAGQRLDPRRRAIVAAWGHYGGHGEARFAPPEAVSPPGPNGAPAAAFDPQNDRALAAWVAGTSSPRVVYSQRSAGPPAGAAAAQAAARSYRTLSAVRRAGTARSGRGIRPVWLSALGLLLLATAGAVRQLSARRRGIHGPRVAARWEGRVRVPRERTRRAWTRRR